MIFCVIPILFNIATVGAQALRPQKLNRGRLIALFNFDEKIISQLGKVKFFSVFSP